MQCPNGQQDKMTNNDLQNFTQKSKVRTTRTSLKSGDELSAVGCQFDFNPLKKN
jgi:hypothetical protein